MAAFGAAAGQAEAHPLNNGYSQVTVNGRDVGYELFLPEQSLLAFDTNGDKRLTPDELAAQRPKLADYVRQRLQLAQNGEPLQFRYEGEHLDDKDGISGVTLLLSYAATRPIEHLSIRYDLLFDDADPQHVNFAIIVNGDDVDQAVFDAAHRTYQYDALPGAGGGWLGTLLQYVWLGMTHIWTGYDHLLFLLCLLVACAGWREAASIVTAFTAAHSVTLILVASGMVRVDSRFVETCIALTIAYVAADNWFARRSGRRRRYRFVVTLGFGLVHGMGFAGALQEIGLPAGRTAAALLSFNAGVELGQLAVLAVLLPLLLRWNKRSWYPRLVAAVSVIVFLLAAIWAVERSGLIGLL
ncbi:hypothetical protein SD70_30055 [Gordoniibacillus kamchatkensis]|uniref:HupE/UreJ family protein n=1 Tax=Gordoniibacillus kamchatkensis TaxID=1590651 RepID=A0ABR5AAH0_9BACL|nr:hypothetical protein SD70_30055 [Paenibacillus sp. VKM B-2647]